MADIPTRSIAQLPIASSVNGNDQLVISQSGITKAANVGLLSENFAVLKVANVTALKALTVSVIQNGTPIFLEGYDNPGDDGSGIVYYISGSSATANDGTIFAPNTGVGRFIREKDPRGVFVGWFGVLSHPTTPVAYNSRLEAAYDFCTTTLTQAGTGEFQGSYQNTLIFGEGQYLYTGTGLVDGNNPSISIKGQGQGVTIINLGSSSYFIKETSIIQSLLLTDITFTGGLGALKNTFTGASIVGSVRVVERCNFFNQTECSIGCLSTDNPYWVIRDCVFYTVNRGIVFVGLADNSVIENCQFGSYTVAIKFGPLAATNQVIRNCGFIPFSTGSNRVDIWLVPGANDFGAKIEGNKFGNEQRDSTDRYILCADENTSSGTDATNYNPATTLSTGYVTNVMLTNNGVFGIGTTSSSFVYSYTPNLIGWYVDNYSSGWFKSFFGYATVADVPGQLVRQSYLNLVNLKSYSGAVEIPVSIAPQANGIILDPLCLGSGQPTIPQYWYSGENGYPQEYLNRSVNGGVGWTGALCTATSCPDSRNGPDAIEIDFSATAGLYYFTLPSSVSVNKIHWLTYETKTASTNSLDFIRVGLQDLATGQIAGAQRFTQITPDWSKTTLPVIFRENSLDFRTIAFYPSGYVASSKDRFQLGGVRFTKAVSPVNRNTVVIRNMVSLSSFTLSAGSYSRVVVPMVGVSLGDDLRPTYPGLNGVNLRAGVSSTSTENQAKVVFENPSSNINVVLPAAQLWVKGYKNY